MQSHSCQSLSTSTFQLCYPHRHRHRRHSSSKPHFPKPNTLLVGSGRVVPRKNHLLFRSPRATNNGETEVELLGKPALVQPPSVEEEEEEEDGEEGEEDAAGNEPSKAQEMEDALAPFLKFFKSRDAAEIDGIDEEGDLGMFVDAPKVDETVEVEISEKNAVAVEYYDPKPGDLVVGVVVSGNDNKLDVNVGADYLGTMLTKEMMPLHSSGEIESSLFDLEKDAEQLMVNGKLGIVKDDEGFKGEWMQESPIVEVGTVIFAEVLGRTLSGRPLLSARRMFRRVAWHRVRQMKHLNEPIEVKITEWNTGGVLTRIEGLRAFLPKAELMARAHNFTDLKENVGRRIHVCISRADEDNNDLIISEKEAWDMKNLKEGTLHEGTVRKIFPFGAQVIIGESNRSGLLHVSNITRERVESVSALLQVDEKVKVLVVKSMFPDKISLSIADLESKPGLFISNKERVFSEAETMAKKYRSRLPAISAYHKPNALPSSTLPFEDESRLYSNWNWFKFDRGENPVC